MANNLVNNPWIIDTAAATVLTTLLLRIQKIRWVAPSAPGDKATVQDQNGNVMYDFTCDTANEDVEDPTIQRPPIQGLVVPTLQSGKLYIYLD